MSFRVKVMVVVLVLGFAVADSTTAQRRREARREEPSEKPEETSADVSAVDNAELTSALGLFVYPADGQSEEQQKAEQAECAAWARQQVGDMPSSKQEGAEAEEHGGRREGRRDGDRSALKGAAKGAVIGEVLEDDEPEFKKNRNLDDMKPPNSRDDIGDNVKHAKKDDDPSAAAVGAAAGAVVGRRRGKKAEGKAETVAEESRAAAAEQAELDDLGKALKACLEGKGYEVE